MAALGLKRVELLAEPTRKPTAEQSQTLCAMLSRRLTGEPLAYIVGTREFYGLEFMVDRRVLIPRPETELLVDKAVEACTEFIGRGVTKPVVADVGTGSACVAVAIAASLPQATVYATDISQDGLDVARDNCLKHGVHHRVKLLCGDLLASLPERIHIIVANLPYVETQELPMLARELSFEPRLALDGGPDGTVSIRRLLKSVRANEMTDSVLLMEIGNGQANLVAGLVHCILPSWHIEIHKDLSGTDRVVAIRRIPGPPI